jgi:hypothetical protein
MLYDGEFFQFITGLMGVFSLYNFIVAYRFGAVGVHVAVFPFVF